MEDEDVRAARLRNLLLGPHPHTSPVGIASWLGAMQAQDLASAMWSLGARLPGFTEAAITAALEGGAILRTWPMRGTIHVVPSADAAWMLGVTGNRALDSATRRREELGLSLVEADRAAATLEAALAGGRRLTRSAALLTLNEAGIQTDGQRGYHLLLYSSQIGVTCIGPQQGAEQTFVLLREWAPNPTRLTRAEGLLELAFRYFRSHGPTTARDFAGWTGLTLTESRAAIAGNDGRLTLLSGDRDPLVVSTEAPADPAASAPKALALPGFDELILGYKDRRLHVPEGALEQIVPGGNGMFRSTIVIDGIVAATWRRTVKRGRVDITVDPLRPLARGELADATSALEGYAAYLERTPTITFAPPR